MQVKLPANGGILDITLFEKLAPLASRCFLQQINCSAWENAVFKLVSDEFISLSPARGTVTQIRKEPQRLSFNKRGLVAFAVDSTSELLFCLSSQARINTGTVFGKLSDSSVRIVDSIASKQLNELNAIDPNASEQLKKVISFEKRLSKWRGAIRQA